MAVAPHAGPRLHVVQAQYEFQATQQQRLTALFEKGAVTTDRLTEAINKMGTLKAEPRLAENELELGQLELSYAQIRAPFSGRSGRIEVSSGSFVSAGKPMVTIVSSDPIIATFNFDQKSFLQLRDGSEDRRESVTPTVQVDVHGTNSDKHEGRITSVTKTRWRVTLDDHTENTWHETQRLS